MHSPRNDIVPAAFTVAPVSEAAQRPRISRKLRRHVGDGAYLFVATLGWFVGNVLGVLGCVIVFFILISAGQWDAFFLQVDNLASRYVAADLGRRGQFEHQLVQVFMLLFITATICRAPGFIRRVRRELASEPRS